MLTTALARAIGRAPVRHLTTAVAGSKLDFDDIIRTVTMRPVVANSEEQSAGIENSKDYLKWLGNKEIQNAKDFLRAAELAVALKDADKVVVIPELMRFQERIQASNGNSLELQVDLFQLLLQLQKHGADLAASVKSTALVALERELSQKVKTAADLDDVGFNILLKLLVRASLTNYELSPDIKKAVFDSIEKRAPRDLHKPCDLLALLNHGSGKNWLGAESIRVKAKGMLMCMDAYELCSLLRYMGVQMARHVELLKPLAQAIAGVGDCLTLSQISGVATSCVKLSFYDARILSRIAKDVQRNSNQPIQWRSLLTIVDSFVRLRVGDNATWKTIVNWALNIEKEANLAQLGMLVSAAARMGVDDAKPLAASLMKRAKREKMLSNDWLNVVHSFAYYGVLSDELADSVLNKDFLKEVLLDPKVAKSKELQLFKAMKLLQVSAAIGVDRPMYLGPRVTKSVLESLGIAFDPESVRAARLLKYGKSDAECSELFLGNLFKVAPRDTHCKPSDVSDVGVLVDAFVLHEEDGSGRMAAVKQWGSRKPRPLFYFGWWQTKRGLEKQDENSLMGFDKLALRILRAQGFKPVVVFNEDFQRCNDDLQILAMLKAKIADH